MEKKYSLEFTADELWYLSKALCAVSIVDNTHYRELYGRVYDFNMKLWNDCALCSDKSV